MQKVIDGNLVHYEIVGNGKKNLLILPGWLSPLSGWVPIANFFKDKYKVILFDFPGFGESSRPKEDWGVYEYADFTEKFLKEIGIQKTTVLGHSFGGRIAIILAGKTDLVDKLILVDAAGMETKSFSVLTKICINKIFGPIFHFFVKEMRSPFESKDLTQSKLMAGIFKKVIRSPLRRELIKVKVPTLIIWGEKDDVLPLKEAKMINKGIAHSVLRIIYNTSHWPHLDKKDEFLEILKEENV